MEEQVVQLLAQSVLPGHVHDEVCGDDGVQDGVDRDGPVCCHRCGVLESFSQVFNEGCGGLVRHRRRRRQAEFSLGFRFDLRRRQSGADHELFGGHVLHHHEFNSTIRIGGLFTSTV